MKIITKILIAAIILTIIAIPAILAFTMDCCDYFCIQRKDYCSTTSTVCTQAERCELGCCTDSLGINHANYPKSKCETSGGEFTQGNCINMIICKE